MWSRTTPTPPPSPSASLEPPQGLSSYAFLYFGAGLGLGVVSEAASCAVLSAMRARSGTSRYGAGRLEDVASRHALSRRLAAEGLPGGTVEEIDALADHPALALWLDEAAPALAGAVLMLENLLDPQTVIVGGALPDRLIDALVSRIALSPLSVANRPDRSLPRLQRGASGRMTATLGAATLVLDQAFTPRIAAS